MLEEKNPKKLARKSKKSPKNPKILKKSKKVKKIRENQNFFPFSDLNLRTHKFGVVNPSVYFKADSVELNYSYPPGEPQSALCNLKY